MAIKFFPEQLKNDFFHFVRFKPQQKKPFEKGWQTTYINYKDIIKWYEAGNNYAVLGGWKDLTPIDADTPEMVKLIQDKFPATFTVKTPKKGMHFYFFCPGIANKIILKKNKTQYGEIFAKGYAVTCPGSIHPDTLTEYTVWKDAPITTITRDFLVDTLKDYIFETPVKHISKGISNIDIVKIAELLPGMKHIGNHIKGPHPIHGSTTGENFDVDITKNLWHCFRCGTGGDAISLIAVLENIIPCEEAKSEGLRGEKFIRTLNIAREKYKLVLPEIMKKPQEPGMVFKILKAFEKSSVFKDVFSYNQWTMAIEIKQKQKWDISHFEKYPREINDNDYIFIKGYLTCHHNLEPSTNMIYEGCVLYAQKNSYHPVKNYLNSLVWDGKPRLETWLIDYGKAKDTPLNRYISQIFLVAPVKRIFEPGCPYDNMIIIEGPQGVYKSRLLEILGQEWYANVTLMEKDKDTIQQMQRAWIIEIGELAVLRKRDTESLKNFITLKFDEARFAYGRRVQQYPRKSVFYGTININDDMPGYLTDNTGNRRFLPINVKFINIEKIQELRDQLFAEAVYLYKKNFRIYIPSELNKALEEEHLDREVFNQGWAAAIKDELLKPTTILPDEVTVKQIYETCITKQEGIEKFSPNVGKEIGFILRKFGAIYDPHQKKIQRLVGRYYNIRPIKDWLNQENQCEKDEFFQEDFNKLREPGEEG